MKAVVTASLKKEKETGPRTREEKPNAGRVKVRGLLKEETWRPEGWRPEAWRPGGLRPGGLGA